MPDSYGFSRLTGKRLDGWDHTRQSIGAILETRLLTRIMRREIGSGVHDLIGRPQTQAVLLRAYGAAKLALVAYEPRYDLVRCVMKPSPDGAPTLELAGVYMPRGHLGDRTPETGVASRMREADIRLVVGAIR